MRVNAMSQLFNKSILDSIKIIKVLEVVNMEDNKELIEVIAERDICGKQFRVWNTPEEPLFLAKDIAQWLGYDGGRKASASMCRILNKDEKVRCTAWLPRGTGYQRYNALFVNEKGLYKITMRSNKPNAVQFQDKVCEILKEIRQTGGYIANSQEMTDDELLMKALDLAQRKIKSRVKQIEC